MKRRFSLRVLAVCPADSSAECEAMYETIELLKEFKVSAQIVTISSLGADLSDVLAMCQESAVQIVVATAGRHISLPAVISRKVALPVISVPIVEKLPATAARLLRSLSSGRGVPTLAFGRAGARNAALAAVSILALADPVLRRRLDRFRERQTREVRNVRLPGE